MMQTEMHENLPVFSDKNAILNQSFSRTHTHACTLARKCINIQDMVSCVADCSYFAIFLANRTTGALDIEHRKACAQ